VLEEGLFQGKGASHPRRLSGTMSRVIVCPECGGESSSRTDEGSLVCDDCGTVLNQGEEMNEVFFSPVVCVRVCTRASVFVCA
jgi:ribosomal protein L37AE/L43A